MKNEEKERYSFRRGLSSIIKIIVIVAIAFGIGRYIGVSQQSEEEIVSNTGDAKDWKMPNETKKVTVTVLDVKSTLKEISEFSTYESKYEVTYGKDTERRIGKDIKIPGTTNNITLACEGVVKVGYDVNDIDVDVYENTIFISLPEKAKINDNYIIWDTVEYNEKNNILNPIEFSQYKDLIDEIEIMGLEQAESRGIYDKAEENFKKIIEGFLAKFDDYKIEYY